MVFERRPIESHRVDEAGARVLAAGALRLLVKAGAGIVRVDRALTEDEVRRYLVHGDGLPRVPVLVRGELLVRGYTEEIYREALDAPDGTADRAR